MTRWQRLIWMEWAEQAQDLLAASQIWALPQGNRRRFLTPACTTKSASAGHTSVSSKH